MKITEAIDKLQYFLNKHGDLDIINLTDIDGNFCIEYEKLFEVIEIPEGDKEVKVCAFIEPINESPELKLL